MVAVRAFAGHGLPTVSLAMMELSHVIVSVQKAKAATNAPAILLATVKPEKTPDTGFEQNAAPPRPVYT